MKFHWNRRRRKICGISLSSLLETLPEVHSNLPNNSTKSTVKILIFTKISRKSVNSTNFPKKNLLIPLISRYPYTPMGHTFFFYRFPVEFYSCGFEISLQISCRKIFFYRFPVEKKNCFQSDFFGWFGEILDQILKHSLKNRFQTRRKWSKNRFVSSKH